MDASSPSGYWSGKVRVGPTSGERAAREWQASARRIQQVRFLSDGGELLVVPLGHDTQVWRLASEPRRVASLPSDFAEATAVALSSDGMLLVAATGDIILRSFDTQSWKEVRSYRGLVLEPSPLPSAMTRRSFWSAERTSRLPCSTLPPARCCGRSRARPMWWRSCFASTTGTRSLPGTSTPTTSSHPTWCCGACARGPPGHSSAPSAPPATGWWAESGWLSSGAQGRTLDIWKR